MLAGVSILCIVFATGASAPSLRGGLMACLTLFAQSTGRTYDALRALCVSTVLILLWNPLLLAYDSGFQLSVAVTPALILGVPVLEKLLLRRFGVKNVFAREVIAVSVVAQLACLPLILWQTGQVGVWALPANILVMWLVPLAMTCTFVAGLVGVVLPPLAPLAGLPAYGVLFYLLAVAKTSEHLPFATTVIPAFPFALVIFMYGAFLLVGYWLSLAERGTESLPRQLRRGNAFQ